jgi:hypothetical protein
MKNNGVRRIVTVLALLVVALFALSVVSPITSTSGLARAAAAAPPTPAAAPAVSSHAPASASPSVAAISPSKPLSQSFATLHPAAGGPHPGTIQSYEYAPGGAPTIDPAVAYYTVDDEVITNVYETLIAFNGTQTGPSYSNWTPEVATCVPGSPVCTAQYGSTLVYNNATNPSQAQYFTFEIDSGARFYDPATGVSWPVYPSDVAFSLARSWAFANLPAPEVFNGWITAQAMLPPGSAKWDGGVHNPYNNTPKDVLTSMLINDSAYCPAPTAPGIHTNGCITFNVGASGLAWPYFLELVSDPLGASVTPCGTFTYVGAGLPGFLGTKAAKGDGPCLLPGNSTSTSQSSFINYVNTVSPTAWDAVEDLAMTNFVSPQPAVQYFGLGSGPYYLVAEGDSGGPGGNGGYTLAANPAYVQPVGCAGAAYCLPPAGKYIPKVDVFWMTADTVDLQALIAGQADTAYWDVSHTSTVLELVSEGKYGLIQNIASGTTFQQDFEQNFSISASLLLDPVKLLNVPDNFFGSSSLREFLVHAYPYTTILNTVWTVDGLHTEANYGGAIPPDQVTYYPTNITWPVGNPDTNPADVNGAAWWWAQSTTSGSIYYDPQLAACSSGSPCQFPIIGNLGNPSLDTAIADWITEIKTLSGGALVPYTYDQTGSQDGANLGLGDGAGNEPIYNFGWVPDYADPTDYLNPIWLPNGTFSFSMATGTEPYEPQYNLASCGHNTYTAFATLVYWANIGEMPEGCSGVAWQTLVAWSAIAAHNPDLSSRALQYNLIEHIGNELAINQYLGNSVVAYNYGSWLSPTGINTNPSVGGGDVQTWWTWQYAANVFNVYFNETGLPGGTSWSVTYGGVTQSSTTASILFAGQVNGTLPYTVTFVPGYSATPANGTVTVNGVNNLQVAITFAALGSPKYTLAFTESGLVSNTTWTMVVVNVGAITSNLPTISFSLPAAAYNYAPGPVIPYSNSGPGSITLTSAGASVAITYAGLITCVGPICTQAITTYSITFSETGLAGGTSWSATILGFTLSSTTSTIVFFETNGTYAFTLGAVTGYTPPASTGQVAVVGANLVVQVPFSAPGTGYAVTFSEKGLPTGAAWNITVNGFGQLSTTTTIVFTLPNNATGFPYNYTVSTIGGYTTTWSGTFTVSSAAETITITFKLFTYTVTFFEGGLPVTAGAVPSWSVNATGTPVSSTTYFLTIALPNGTAKYTVGVPTGYVATPASGSITVSAGPASAVIIFSLIPATYAVTFTESGLPSGGSWEVYLNGAASGSLTGATTTFSEPNGTYTFTVVTPTGYSATSSATGNTVTVNGAAVAVTVTIAQTVTSTSSGIDKNTGLSTLAYALIGLFIALTVIFLVLALMFRRKPPTPGAPQTWTPGETGGEGQTPPPSM